VWSVTLRRARQPLTTNPSELARLQQPDPVMRHTGDDVMALLQACFQAQQKPRTTVYLSGVCTCAAGALHLWQVLTTKIFGHSLVVRLCTLLQAL
jgi:hypothetical protein